MDQDTCCQCGMEKDHWTSPAGFVKESDTYCCERCADERGCQCEEVLRAARSALKPIRVRPTPPAQRAGSRKRVAAK